MSVDIQIDAIKNGSEKAFTELYYHTYEKVFHYFLKKTKEESRAIELVQITYIKFWRFKHTLSTAFSIDKQLFIIARSCLLDYIRQKSTYKANHIELSENRINLINTRIVADYDFEERNYFETVVNTLPPVRKKVFLLSRINGLSNKEIAETLTISVNTVEDHITKAIRHIKTLISIIAVVSFSEYF